MQTLEKAKDGESETIDSLEKENDDLREKLSKLKSHYMKLFDFAKKNNIELKPRNVPMGSLDSTWKSLQISVGKHVALIMAKKCIIVECHQCYLQYE